MQSSIIYDCFKNNCDAISLLKEGKYLAVNNNFLSMLGLNNTNQIIARSPTEFSPEFQADGQRSEEKVKSILRQALHYGYGEFDWLFKKNCGELLPVRVSLKKVGKFKDNYLCATVKCQIVFHNFMDKLSSFFFEKSSDAMLVANGDRRIIAVNDAFSDVTGYSREEAVGQNTGFARSGRHGSSFYLEMWQKIKSLGFWEGEIWDKHKSGYIFPKRLQISAIKDKEGAVTHYLGIFRETKRELAYRDSLKKLAFYDSLTGLPNRRLLMDKLHELTDRGGTGNTEFALIIIDVDNFKEVNDKHGHAVGDQILIHVANQITSVLNEQSLLGRLGGDEFLLLTQAPQLLNFVETLLTQMATMFTKQVCIEGIELRPALSLGISYYPAHSLDRSELMYFADLALYQAKAKMGTSHQTFQTELADKARAKSQLIDGIASGLVNNEFVAHFQPKYQANTLQLTGFEALVRWQHPLRGLLAPSHFIEVAQEANLLSDITEQVIEQACQMISTNKLPMDVPVSVNFTGEQISQATLVELISRYVDKYKIRFEQLELEITETLLVEHITAATENLHRLKRLGMQIALDDFGKGYSSLSYLKSLPIDKLKIDKFFVDDIDASSNSSRNLVKAIIQLGQAQGIEVVAEGVETVSQLDVLRALECNHIQGYLLSRPVAQNLVNQTMQIDHLVLQH